MLNHTLIVLKELNIIQNQSKKGEDDSNNPTTEKSNSKTSTKSDSGTFGGFKKGFLFGGSGAQKSKVKSSSSEGSKMKSSSEMPYITKKSAEEVHKLPEVQQTLTAEAQKITQNKGSCLLFAQMTSFI